MLLASCFILQPFLHPLTPASGGQMVAMGIRVDGSCPIGEGKISACSPSEGD